MKLEEIRFTTSTDSRASEVEAKMKRFIELLKAEEKFGDYRHQIGLILEENKDDASDVLPDSKYRATRPTDATEEAKELYAQEQLTLHEVFKDDLKEHSKEKKKLIQGLKLVASSMHLACDEYLKERLLTQDKVSRSEYEGNPIKLRRLILLHAGSADPRKQPVVNVIQAIRDFVNVSQGELPEVNL